ncbi:MAG: hypothetical protein IPM03_21485 [Sulfuritalea sp.]|nr:hypothetical protein [Sulfuritalea sp.]
MRRETMAMLFCAMIFGSLYALATQRLAPVLRVAAAPELLVTLPRFAQVIMATGDRFLAANLLGFRVLIASTDRMQRADFVVQAQLQRDAAWLNPAHEDNYYIAASILPWNGEVAAAQYVLKRAMDARQFDWSPLFQYGFLFYHFRRDPAEGAKWLLAAADRATAVQDQWALQNVAAHWIEKGYETRVAANLVESMAQTAPSGNFRNYLHIRATRLGHLAHLRELSEEYHRVKGQKLKHLDELVTSGLLPSLPSDPLNFGFDVDPDGRPFLRSTSPEIRK